MQSKWPTSGGGFGRLVVDELYENVLGVAFWGDSFRHDRLQILHTVLCAVTKIDMSVIAELNNICQDTVKTVVDSLYAVLFISSKDDCVYWYHTSFPDFIFTQGRAKFKISPQPNYQSQEINVFCDESAHHAVLACQCFSIMKELHFNMCDLDSSYVFDSDVLDLSDRTHKKLTPTIRYASRHWAKHLSRAPPAEIDTNELFLCLNEFMCDKLLFWIEAMNLIDARFECAPLLKDAEDWFKRVRNILSTRKCSDLNDILGNTRTRPAGVPDRCCKVRNLFCRVPCSKVNSTFIHFRIIYMVSTFASLDTLETPVHLDSINYTTHGHYHSPIADNKNQ